MFFSGEYLLFYFYFFERVKMDLIGKSKDERGNDADDIV